MQRVFSILFTAVFKLQILYKGIGGVNTAEKETKVYTNDAANDDK